MDAIDKILSIPLHQAPLIDEDDAKQAAADYIRQVNSIDSSMGWRLEDVVAAFLAGAAWWAVR